MLSSGELLEVNLVVIVLEELVAYAFTWNTLIYFILFFLRKWDYLWSYCVGLERVIAYTHTWRVLRTWMLDWMIQKKKQSSSPFNLSLTRLAFSHFQNHTCLHSSTGHSTFIMEPCWIQPSQGWFNSHVGECDDVTLGLWHTWINNAAVWRISQASDES